MNKSQFDTGNWSPLNGLPGQDDMINYLEYLLNSNPNKTYCREDLMKSITNEFGIPWETAIADCPNCETSALYTRLTYLICDGINGVRRANGNVFMKRVGTNQYQSVNGNLKASHNPYKYMHRKVSKKMVEQAEVSVKILKELNHIPEQIVCELSGKWTDFEIEAAINNIFYPKPLDLETA